MPEAAPAPAAPAAAPTRAAPVQSVTTAKTYVTENSGDGRRVNPARAAQLVTSAPPPVTRTTIGTPKTAPAPEAPTPVAADGAVVKQDGQPVVGVETPVAAAEPVSDSAPTETPAAEPAKVEDAATRLARINRADRALTERKRELATREQALSTASSTFDKVAEIVGSRNPEHILAAVNHVRLVQQGAQTAKQNPLKFMQQAFGIEPQHIIDALIAEHGKKPEQKQADAVQQTAEQLKAEFQAKLDEQRKLYESTRVQDQARDYINANINPLASKYPFVSSEYGASFGNEVYNAIAAEYSKTGKAPSPTTVLEAAEKLFRARHVERQKLLGPSTQPAQPATAKKVETPTATRPVSVLQPSAEPVRVRKRAIGKPYTTTPR